MPANILNLPAYTITGIEETEYDYHIPQLTCRQSIHLREFTIT